MVARIVLVCDVCGAMADDHYPFPVARARKLARALGFTYRRKATQPGDYRGSSASYRRIWFDLCPEHTYSYDLTNVPTQKAEWNWRRRGGEAESVQPIAPEPSIHYADVSVIYEDGDGPYRLYTAVARGMREAGASRPQLERLRREMFAAGADFIEVAARWARVTTGDREDEQEQDSGADEL